MSLDALGDEFSMSSLKIRKLLVTAGVYDTPLCRRVQEWYESGKSVKEICSLTGLSAASVSGYLPYRRTVYKLKERTLLAERPGQIPGEETGGQQAGGSAGGRERRGDLPCRLGRHLPFCGISF